MYFQVMCRRRHGRGYIERGIVAAKDEREAIEKLGLEPPRKIRGPRGMFSDKAYWPHDRERSQYVFWLVVKLRGQNGTEFVKENYYLVEAWPKDSYQRKLGLITGRNVETAVKKLGLHYPDRPSKYLGTPMSDQPRGEGYPTDDDGNQYSFRLMRKLDGSCPIESCFRLI